MLGPNLRPDLLVFCDLLADVINVALYAHVHRVTTLCFDAVVCQYNGTLPRGHEGRVRRLEAEGDKKDSNYAREHEAWVGSEDERDKRNGDFPRKDKKHPVRFAGFGDTLRE